jgi:hypothetical protein
LGDPTSLRRPGEMPLAGEREQEFKLVDHAASRSRTPSQSATCTPPCLNIVRPNDRQTCE